MARLKAKFKSLSFRLDHFKKHGRARAKASTPRQYEMAAADFLLAPLTPDVIEKIRLNGDRVRYNKRSEEFGIITAPGIIRTYFIPDPAVHGFASNLDYYHAQ